LRMKREACYFSDAKGEHIDEEENVASAKTTPYAIFPQDVSIQMLKEIRFCKRVSQADK